MIQEYFGLTGEPFGKEILPEHLYLSLRFKELLARQEFIGCSGLRKLS